MSVIKLVEVSREMNIAEGKDYKLREVYVNPDHVIMLREDAHTTRLLQEKRLPENLDSRQSFTRLTMQRGSSGTEIVVVGTPDTIREKLFKAKAELLKG
jgi:alkanesulfonate monooxygenase SsuD/methylene tetrahydromethanopterin reductase-like flavin-dependent oxidoreductase (luciferase family)